jgi:hypothetical protein
VKILDFGLAKLAEPNGAPAGAVTVTLNQTGAGVVMGTAGYMSRSSTVAPMSSSRSGSIDRARV